MTLLKIMPNCAYYKGKFKTEGTVIIYDEKIVFEPADSSFVPTGLIGAAFNNAGKNEVFMRDIMRVERHRVMGVNCCIKALTKDGAAHIYSLWPFRKELDGIIGLINQNISV